MTSRIDGRGAGPRPGTGPRPPTPTSRLLVAAASAGTAVAAVLGSGASDVTGAVWLAGRVCGSSPPSGFAFLMPAAMLVAALAAARAEGGAPSWCVAVLARLGPMAALHVAVMLGDEASRRAGSVLLGREFRAAILAGLVAASWLARGIAVPSWATCAARCGLGMALLLLAAPVHWTLAAAAAAILAGDALLPEGAARRRLPLACGLPAIVAVAVRG